jgi:hypothetical protein
MMLDLPKPNAEQETSLGNNIRKMVDAYERDFRQKAKMALRLEPEVLFSAKTERLFSTRLILLLPIAEVGTFFERPE